MTDPGKDFADLAYTIIVTERRYAMKRIASEMGLGYDAMRIVIESASDSKLDADHPS